MPLPDIGGTAPTSSGVGLHSLPAEVLERVLIFSDPRDVSRYAQTCSLARKLVYEPKDHFLWRELYLGRPFDDLRQAVPVPRPHVDAYATSINAIPEVDIDASSPAAGGGPPSWRTELQRRIEAEAIATSGSSADARGLLRAYQTFISAVDTALPVDEDETREDPKAPTSRSENLHWLDRLLRRTKMLDLPVPSPSTSAGSSSSAPCPALPKRELRPTKARARPPTPEDMLTTAASQLRARLRAYVALSHENSFQTESCARMAALQQASRSYVYDMRRYRPETLWGPYRLIHPPQPQPEVSAHDGEAEMYADTDGERISEVDVEADWRRNFLASLTRGADAPGGTVVVNWEHVEHILNVVGLKLREIPADILEHYKKPLFTLQALRAYSAVGAQERLPHDWAGVTGKWRRFVCFMDYRDLYRFNHEGRDPSFFKYPFDEALRPVELHLSLIPASEYLADARGLLHALHAPLPDPDADERFPTLYFEGHSRGPHASSATIRGTVSTLADGAVRWQFVTTYDGRMQWSAEGVQIGHVCSAAGIAGIWTSAHHESEDPAGPFWMVRANDDLPEGVLNVLY